MKRTSIQSSNHSLMSGVYAIKMLHAYFFSRWNSLVSMVGQNPMIKLLSPFGMELEKNVIYIMMDACDAEYNSIKYNNLDTG